MRRHILRKEIIPTSLTVFTSPTCTLCEPTKFICKKVAKELNKRYNKEVIRYKAIDILQEQNTKWKALYEYKIPVVHIDSKKVWSATLKENKLLEPKLKTLLEKNIQS